MMSSVAGIPIILAATTSRRAAVETPRGRAGRLQLS
jgi:hypothetical protein